MEFPTSLLTREALNYRTDCHTFKSFSPTKMEFCSLIAANTSFCTDCNCKLTDSQLYLMQLNTN